MSNSFLPIFVITGFLGSGKTTLLSNLLSAGKFPNTALIINEFGDIGIDHLLVESASDEIVELSNGCICCTLRGAIIDTLDRLSQNDNLDRIIIETTGLCDPAPLLRPIMNLPNFRFMGLITTIDTLFGEKNLELHQEAINQVSFADTIIFTKTDISPISDSLRDGVRSLNPHADILLSQDIETFKSILLDTDASTSTPRNFPNANIVQSVHSSSLKSFTMRSTTPIELSRLQRFLDSFTHSGLLRIKGIVSVKDTERSINLPCIVQGIQGTFAPLSFCDSWPSDIQETRLVIIADIGYQSGIEKLFNALLNNTTIDTPDFDAIDRNPLSITNWRG